MVGQNLIMLMKINSLLVTIITDITIFNSLDASDGIFWLWGVNAMPADSLAPKVARASAGMVLTVQDRQYVLLLQS